LVVEDEGDFTVAEGHGHPLVLQKSNPTAEPQGSPQGCTLDRPQCGGGGRGGGA